MDFSLLGFTGLKEVFNIHPVFVHFPVALFPSAFFLYLLGVILKKSPLRVAGRACLYLALAGAVVAVVTGLIAEDSIPHNETIHHLMQTHKVLGWMVLGVGVVLSGWSFWHVDQTPKGKWGFLAILAFAAYLVSQTGDIGGRMVFIEGAAVKPAVPIITQGESADEPAREEREPDERKPGLDTHDHSGHQH